jgi:hypothetical protein
MTTATTIYEIAREAAQWFERRDRDDGTPYVTLKDGRPEWLHDLAFEAHGRGEMLPDDWRYGTLSEALLFVADNEPDDMDDAAHEFADQRVDVYNGDLCAWLGSHSARAGYCNQAAEDGLIGNDVDVMRIIAAGQYVEALEVWGTVAAALQARADEIAD